MEFARQLQATVDPAIKDRDQRMYEAKEKALADGVVSRNAWEKAPLTASSDSGGVSQMHADEPHCSNQHVPLGIRSRIPGRAVHLPDAFDAQDREPCAPMYAGRISHCKQQHMKPVYTEPEGFRE